MFTAYCIDGTATMVNFEPVDEHRVVLKEGEKYHVVDTFYAGPYLFYILEGSRNAYDSAFFLRLSDQSAVERLMEVLESEYYENINLSPLKTQK